MRTSCGPTSAPNAAIWSQCSLASRAKQAHLQVRDADRAEALVRELGDLVGRTVHHALRQVPRGLTDVRDEVVADLGHRARAHLVALAQDRRRCRRGADRAAWPAGSNRRPWWRRAAARACPNRRSRSAGAAAAPDAGAGRPRSPDAGSSTRCVSASEITARARVGELAPVRERHPDRVELALHVARRRCRRSCARSRAGRAWRTPSRP